MKHCSQKSRSLPEAFTASTLLAGCTEYNFYSLKPMEAFTSGVFCTHGNVLFTGRKM